MPDRRGAAAFLSHLGAKQTTADELLARASTTTSIPGRVVRAERIAAEVATADGAFLARWEEPVCTGDWVLADPGPVGGSGSPSISGRITWLAPRRTAFVRRSADSDVPQVLAANIDEAWLVVAADEPAGAARLERALVLAWDSGALPVVVVTKTDRAVRVAVDRLVAALHAVGPAVEAVEASSVTGEGLALLRRRLGPGASAALIGRSGAGKSTLVNALAGSEVAVGEVRARDGKGRHTTSWRELVVAPGGGALIDTPGLRGIGLWVERGGLEAAFADITDLAAGCRFSDCTHDGEPGCAVQAAVASGDLDRTRLERYQALWREAADTAARRQARLEARLQRASASRRARIRADDRRRSGD